MDPITRTLLKVGAALLMVAAVLGAGWWALETRYDAGLEAGRAECQTAAVTAQLQEAQRLQADAERRADKESARADAAYRTAGVRENQASQVEANAQAQANADEVCLTMETADAIRSIR